MAARKPSGAHRPSVAARGNTFVTIEIGTLATRYYVHRSLLEEHSEYFKNALNGSWIESQEGVVKLEDVECGIFEIFIDWLYTGHLPKDLEKWDNGNDERRLYAGVDLAVLKTYVLGDRLIVKLFQKRVQKFLVRWYSNDSMQPVYESIIFAFANLPQDDIILKLLVDAHCHTYMPPEADTDEIGELRAQLPHDFLLRVMLRYSMLKHKAIKDRVTPCDYHEHESEKEKETCKEKKTCTDESNSDSSCEGDNDNDDDYDD